VSEDDAEDRLAGGAWNVVELVRRCSRDIRIKTRGLRVKPEHRKSGDCLLDISEMWQLCLRRVVAARLSSPSPPFEVLAVPKRRARHVPYDNAKSGLAFASSCEVQEEDGKCHLGKATRLAARKVILDIFRGAAACVLKAERCISKG
jgi:hypothetical protein